jgi:dipeptidyl aminopeptidase/acylaminoacyl peptidase
MAQKFDPQTVSLSGSIIPLADRVGREARFPGLAAFTASLGGAVAYREDSSVARQLKWIDRTGKPVGTPGPFDSASPQSPRVSPDGRSVLFYRQSGSAIGSVWVMDTETGATRMLRDPSHRAVWSPDGKTMVFATLNNNGVGPVLFEQPLPSGAGRFLLPGVQGFPSDVSANGALLYTSTSAAGDVMLVPPGGTAVPIANSPAAERGARFSPNGQWIVYQSDESGRPEIYVQPVGAAAAQRQRVSLSGGINPEWDPKRQALYFLSPDYHLMMAAAEATSDNKSIEFSTPKALFERPLGSGSEYAPSPDGERFFVIEPGEDAPPIVVLSNWAR